MRVESRLAGVLSCFALSGFAALLFQVAWTREFALVFGTSELAIATVLAGYMGGLAVGAALCARFEHRVRRPLLAYGLLELAIGASAYAVPHAIRACERMVVALFGGLSELPSADGGAIALFYIAATLAIVGIPTACMGATLPLLARSCVRSDAELGPRVAMLYATNTAGAVAGAIGAAFFLLPALGLRGSIYVGIAANLAAFGVAVLLARRLGSEPATPPEAGSSRAAERSPALRLASAAMFASGAASFAYELLWTRLLGHVFGGSLYAFATMLASFLSGIAIGSALASRVATTPERAARAFGTAQLAIAAASLAVFAALDLAPALALAVGAARDVPLANALVAALTLLPATLAIGATYPLAVRSAAAAPAQLGAVSARIYAFNTAGGIAGSLATGFFGLPLLGYRGVLVAAMAINLALAALWATRCLAAGRPRLRRVAACAALLALAAATPAPLRLLASSPFDLAGPAASLLYHGVGRSASIAAAVGRQGSLEIRSNGLAESNLRLRGESETYAYAWLAALASLLRPETRELLVIGFGGGGVLETLPSTVERIDVVEIEPEILRANAAVAELRAVDPLRDPRLRVTLNDVRGALLRTTKRWDAIVSQPSHPWTEGASHLYTQGFFELARQHLRPGGVFVQWVGLPFLDPFLLRSCIATLRRVFAHVQVYLPYPYGEVYFAASDAPLDWKTSARRFIGDARADAARFGVFSLEDVALALRLDDAEAAELAAGAEPIRDDRNAFQFRTRGDIGGALALLEHPGRFGDERLAGLDRSALARRLLASGRRAEALRVLPGAARELGALPALVERARELALREDWRSVEALDASLAAFAPVDAGYAEAAEARVRWRVASRDPARAREAVAIADAALPLSNRFEFRFERARALALAGDTRESATALAQILRQLARFPASAAQARTREALHARARRVLAELPSEGPEGVRRRELERWTDSVLGSAVPAPGAAASLGR
jgi:spermidine synthase